MPCKRSRFRPIRSLLRDEAIEDIQHALRLATQQSQSKQPSPAEIMQTVERLRNRCRLARLSYERVLNSAVGEPLLSALPREAEWIDVVRELGDTITKLAQHERWFARAQKIAIGRVSRGRPTGTVKSETDLTRQLIPVFEHHTGLRATPSTAGTTPFMRFFSAVREEAAFPVTSENWIEHVRKLIAKDARHSVLPRLMWSDLPLGE